MRGWIKWAMGTALFAVLVVGFIGWMHTPGARPILGALGVKCPITKNANPVVMDNVRRQQMAAPDAPLAPRRPALGLELDKSTLKDGRAWADQRGLKCSEHQRGYEYLQCPSVLPSAIGEAYSAAPIDMLVLTFGSKGTLIGVQTYRRGVSVGEVVAILTGGQKSLARDLGPPTATLGSADDPAFQNKSAGYAAAQVNYKFKDYLATLSAARLPGSGVVVMEKFYSTTL